MSQPVTPSTPKVAIVHDWLYGGGAEKVVYELHQMFPEAPIYTSYCSKEWRRKLDGKVVTGFLQHWPFSRLRKFVPFLRIWWFTHLNLEGYDLVISSSGAEAKGVKVPAGVLHINYCHAPTHYYWSRYDEYMKRPGFGSFDPLARLGLWLLVRPLRKWDYIAAQRPDYIIANSSHIQAEIKKYYGRDSTVIFPPVSLERFRHQDESPRRSLVVSGRQTPYKRFDLAIQACSKLKLPLMVVGNGPDHERLVSLAGDTVRFRTNASDEVVEEAFQSASGLIFPGLDDFGITPIEAMAAGTPVIAYRGGGAMDYIVPGVTGEFFAEQTVESLVEALERFRPNAYDHQKITASTERFSSQHFQDAMRAFIAQCQQK